MIAILRDNPLLFLFVVAAIGYSLGRIKVRGSSLGDAAVLFVGIAFGALHPDLKLPEIVYVLGMVLFVYTIGLSSGPRVVASLRGSGVRGDLLVVGMLLIAALLAVAAHTLLRLTPGLTSGIFSGSLNNVPALAGALDYLRRHAPAAGLDRLLAEPVAGFSVAYPTGVIGSILAIFVAQRVWKIDYARESRRVHEPGLTNERLQNRTIRVTRPHAARETLLQLVRQHGWDIIVGRVQHDDQVSVPTPDTCLEIGDLVSVVGVPEMLDRVTAYLGETGDERFELDHSQLDQRRVFVSNRKVAGHRLRDLNLPHHFGAIVTHVRRGDVELLPHGDTVLELGDQVGVLAQRDNMDAVSSFFGDSYRGVSEVDMAIFSLGLALGLLLGLVPIPLPGGGILRLGVAGGPLIVGLALGALERTGPIVWTLPYSANLMLRQIGLVCFFGAIGTRSGYAFVTTLSQSGGLTLLVAGSIITCTTSLLTLWIGYRLLKIPMSLLIGIAAGLQTQPAALGFALQQTGDDLPNVGYATVLPIALVTKIILAQLLLIFLL